MKNSDIFESNWIFQVSYPCPCVKDLTWVIELKCEMQTITGKEYVFHVVLVSLVKYCCDSVFNQ